MIEYRRKRNRRRGVGSARIDHARVIAAEVDPRIARALDCVICPGKVDRSTGRHIDATRDRDHRPLVSW